MVDFNNLTGFSDVKVYSCGGLSISLESSRYNTLSELLLALFSVVENWVAFRSGVLIKVLTGGILC